MVSDARRDLPEPLRPVITTRLSRGSGTSTLFRLCSRAPRIVSWLVIAPRGTGGALAAGGVTIGRRAARRDWDGPDSASDVAPGPVERGDEVASDGAAASAGDLRARLTRGARAETRR